MGSQIVGWLLVALGSMTVVVGLVIATVDTLQAQSAGAFGKSTLKFIELLTGLLDVIAKFKLPAQLIIFGSFFIAGGTALLIKEPF